MKLPWMKKRDPVILVSERDLAELLLSDDVSAALGYRVKIALDIDDAEPDDGHYQAWWYEPRTKTNWSLRGFWIPFLPKYEDRRRWVEGAVAAIRRHEARRQRNARA